MRSASVGCEPNEHTSSGRGEGALRQLERDGLLRREHAAYRTTRRWQGAMARAALRLYDGKDEHDDLRFPVAMALVELYGPHTSHERIVELVEAMLPIEAAELSPRHLSLLNARRRGRRTTSRARAR